MCLLVSAKATHFYLFEFTLRELSFTSLEQFSVFASPLSQLLLCADQSEKLLTFLRQTIDSSLTQLHLVCLDLLKYLVVFIDR